MIASYGREYSMKIKHHVNRLAAFLRRHRKAVVIISIIVAILGALLTGYIFSRQNWDDYKSSYNQFYTEAESNLENTLDQISDKSDDSNSDKLSAIISLQDKLTSEIDTICQPDSTFEWQKFISSIESEIQSCEDKKANLNITLEKLTKVTDYLTAEQAVAEIISSANSKTTKNNSVDKWNTISAFWTDAVTEVDKLTVSEEFESIKKSAKTYLTQISSAWKALSTANSDENRSDFETAEASLDTAYNNLQKLSTASKKQINSLIANFD